MPGRTQADYLQKAAIYDMLSRYHKYSNPQLSAHYYQKQMKHMDKAMRNPNGQSRTAPGYIRLLHGAPGAGNVDIFVNETKIFTNYPYKRVSEYLPLPPGKYQIDVYPSGNHVHTLLSQRIFVEPGQTATLAVAGQDNKMKLIVLNDDVHIPKNEAKIRFVHLSPDTGAADPSIKNGPSLFKNLSYRKNTGYLAVMPAAAELELRLAGTGEALPLPKMEFEPGRAYTIYVIGLSGGTPGIETLFLSP